MIPEKIKNRLDPIIQFFKSKQLLTAKNVTLVARCLLISIIPLSWIITSLATDALLICSSVIAAIQCIAIPLAPMLDALCGRDVMRDAADDGEPDSHENMNIWKHNAVFSLALQLTKYLPIAGQFIQVGVVLHTLSSKSSEIKSLVHSVTERDVAEGTDVLMKVDFLPPFAHSYVDNFKHSSVSAT